MFFDVVGGDFQGKVLPKKPIIGFVKAKNFLGLQFLSDGKTYKPDEIVRCKTLSASASLDDHMGAAAIGGGVLFGAAGAIAGGLSGKKTVWTLGVEFSDGKKVILRTKQHQTVNMQVFRKFIEERHLEEFDF